MPTHRNVRADTTPADTKKQETGFYDAYSHFGRTLRLWFIAYGIGAPVVFLNNPAAVKPLFSSGWGQPVAFAFLLGVGLQILVALIYKGAMWYLYLGEIDDEFKQRARFKVAEWLSEAFWIEALADLGSLLLFSWATYHAIGTLAP